MVADEANRLLGERLGKAPILFGRWSEEGMSFEWRVGLNARDVKDGTTNAKGYLVCVEVFPTDKELHDADKCL